MIVHLQGTLVAATPLSAVVDVQGIGYEVHIPVTTAEKLPATGQKVFLHTLAVYREDAQNLYGFATTREREFFRLLVEKVSGIGPRIAISILSRLSVDMLQQAIAQGDVALLAKCPGIGKKTAERLVVELRDKLAASLGGGIGAADASASGGATAGTAGAGPSNVTDAVAALVALGYKLADADKSVRKALEAAGSGATTEELIRKALSA